MAISSVVLSSQRVELKEALYNAEKDKDRNKEEAVNPLVQNGPQTDPQRDQGFPSGPGNVRLPASV